MNEGHAPEVEAIAIALAQLVNRAPAGGVFHDAKISRAGVLHDGYSNEQRWFCIDTNGTSYTVSVERNRAYSGR